MTMAIVLVALIYLGYSYILSCLIMYLICRKSTLLKIFGMLLALFAIVPLFSLYVFILLIFSLQSMFLVSITVAAVLLIALVTFFVAQTFIFFQSERVKKKKNSQDNNK